jgi:hypothetical protein
MQHASAIGMPRSRSNDLAHLHGVTIWPGPIWGGPGQLPSWRTLDRARKSPSARVGRADIITIVGGEPVLNRGTAAAGGPLQSTTVALGSIAPSAQRYDALVTVYRDPLAGLRSQIATKRGLLDSQERRVPALLRALFPAALEETIASLRERALAEGDTIESLSAIDGALDGILAAYDEGIAMLPRLRECPADVPDPPRPKMAPPWILEEDRQKHFRLRFDQRVRGIAPETYLVRWGDETYLARFKLAGAPLIATARIDTAAEIVAHFWSTLRTSVPRDTPSLSVRMEGTLEGVGKMLGLVEDRKTGSDALDETFIVGGSEAALALLGPDIVAGLLALVPFKPSLRVSRGVAELAWTGRDRAYASDLLPDDALIVVLGIRAAIERA